MLLVRIHSELLIMRIVRWCRNYIKTTTL